MNKSIKTLLLLSGILAIGLSYSCKKDTIEITDESKKLNRIYEVAAPVGTAQVTIQDILDDPNFTEIKDYIKEDENGELYLYYVQKDTNAYTFKDILDGIPSMDTARWIEPNELLGDIGNLGNLPQQVGSLKSMQADYSYKDTIALNLEENIKLDSLVVNEAKLVISLQNLQMFTGNVTIAIPTITKNGIPVEKTFDLATSSINESPDNVDLSDHTIAFDISNPDYPHGFIEVVTTFSNVGLKEITSIPTEKIGLKFEINAIEPQYAFGKFGSASIDQEPIDQKFSLFEDLEWDHTIEFDDYKIRLETVNPYGVSFETSFDNITFVNEETGTSGQLIITDPNPEFTIHPATWGIPIIPRISNNTLSKANSNIAALNIGGFKPNRIIGSYSTRLVPQADDVIEFIGMSDTVFNTLYMTAPLYFRATNYCHPEFFDLDIIDILTDGEGLDENGEADTDYSENIKDLKLYFDFTNGLPFNLQLQAYLLNADSVRVDSIFNKNEETITLLRDPEIADNGYLVNKEGERSQKEVYIDQQQVKKWKDEKVKIIEIYTCGNTPKDGTEYVKLTKENFLKIKVKVDAKGRYEE